MIIAPIIFCTVVHGIASMQDMKKVGRVGLKALVYFEGPRGQQAREIGNTGTIRREPSSIHQMAD
jgi:hypothetical protein